MIIPKINSNIKASIELSKCGKIETNEHLIVNFILCNLTETEIEYFDYTKDNYISYNVLCGKKVQMQLNIHKLNLDKYPSFTIKKIIMPNKNYFTRFNKFSFYADIEGKYSFNEKQIFSFYLLADFENNKYKEINMLECSFKNIKDDLSDSECQFECSLLLNDMSTEKIEFLPYILYNETSSSCEIITEHSIIAQKIPSFSSYLKISLCLFLSIMF